MKYLTIILILSIGLSVNLQAQDKPQIRQQCQGTTKAGLQCKRMITQTYCHDHGGQLKKVEPKGESVQCSGTTQKGLPCQRKTTNLNGKCSSHQSQIASR